jgi:hypothetical protein
MEAANRGARDVGGRSVGCNIRLPLEQAANPFLDRSITCQHFFVRKVLLFKYSYAFVALPGGFGTLDEIFEAITLVQTGKTERFPIVLIGVEHWQPLIEFMTGLAGHGMIDEQDLRLVLATGDLDETMGHIRRHAIDRFGLSPRRWPASRLRLAFRALRAAFL